MKTILLFAALSVLLIIGPNLLWLARSTASVTNDGSSLVSSVNLIVQGKKVPVGDLLPGDSKLVLLPHSGDATLSVHYSIGGIEDYACQEYVEGAMYHVQVTFMEGDTAKCHVNLPLTSELLISKLL